MLLLITEDQMNAWLNNKVQLGPPRKEQRPYEEETEW